MDSKKKKDALRVPFIDDKGGIEITIRGQRWTIRRAKKRLLDDEGEHVASMIVEVGLILIDPNTPDRWLPAVIAHVVAMAAEEDGNAAPPVEGTQAVPDERHEALPAAENRRYAKDFEAIAKRLMES